MGDRAAARAPDNEIRERQRSRRVQETYRVRQLAWATLRAAHPIGNQPLRVAL